MDLLNVAADNKGTTDDKNKWRGTYTARDKYEKRVIELERMTAIITEWTGMIFKGEGNIRTQWIARALMVHKEVSQIVT